MAPKKKISLLDKNQSLKILSRRVKLQTRGIVMMENKI